VGSLFTVTGHMKHYRWQAAKFYPEILLVSNYTRDFSWLSKYLVIMELCFDTMLFVL